MALPINIGDLLHGRTVEWERIEFKEGWNPEEVMHTICAFANDYNNWGGGYIVIGIKEDNGVPVFPAKGVSLQDIDSIQKKLLNLCHLIKPNYFPVAEPSDLDGVKILVIWVPGGQNIPYQAPISLADKSGHAYYIRRFSSTVKARAEEISDLIAYTGKIPFDDRINHHADIADLQLPLIREFLRDVQSDLYKESANMDHETLCRQMRIVMGAKEYPKPINAGLLFYNDNPQRYIPYSQLEVVQFKTGTAGDKLSEKIFTGPIHHQIREVLGYLKNAVIKEYVEKIPDQAQAMRYYNYPFAALEETIVNAMYHRDYEIREPVEIRVHPDRMEIVSYPGPDRSISVKDLQNCKLIARRYRNRRIGEFLKELRYTEGRCTGIPKILSAMKANGSPKPKFITDEERSYFITILPINKKAHKEETPQETPQVTPQDKLTALEQKVLDQIRKNPRVSRNELAESIGVKPDTVKEYLEKLKKKNAIKRIGKTSAGYWEILTRKDL
jgi:ATP-dependent DNA helicase RecG